MRRVDQAVIRPNHCAAIPHLGSTHRKGYFDTGSELPGFDNHVYISVEFCEQRAVDLGWTSPQDAVALNDRIAHLERELAGVRAEIEAADRFAESARYTLERFGQKVQNKPGPKPKAVV